MKKKYKYIALLALLIPVFSYASTFGDGTGSVFAGSFGTPFSSGVTQCLGVYAESGAITVGAPYSNTIGSTASRTYKAAGGSTCSSYNTDNIAASALADGSSVTFTDTTGAHTFWSHNGVWYNTDPSIVNGCTDSTATNYNSSATVDDGSCTYPPPTAPTDTIGALISGNESGFASTTGFNVSAVAVWAGDNLIKLFIGSGLAVLFDLRYWIAALLIIGIIIGFSYRAFRFFRH